MRYPSASLSRSWCIRSARARARAHIKACSGHFRRRGGTRPFHQDIRYAICSLSVPLYRVIFPVLVGTTTASRNALRLASPDMRVCSFTTRRRRQLYAIYSQYTHVRADTQVCARLLMRASFTRAHICPCVRVHTWTERVCRTNCMAEPFTGFRSRLSSASGKGRDEGPKRIVPRFVNNVRYFSSRRFPKVTFDYTRDLK